MSLAFSNTTDKNGIIQGIERTLHGEDGDARISGNATLMAMATAEVNLALSRAMHIIFTADGTWQYDDANHTGYNILTTNLVSGQRAYSFTEDTAGNLLISLHRAAILSSATDTTYQDIYPADAQTDEYSPFVTNDTTAVGVPYTYDKTATGIFVDPIPNYNATAGLKIYVDREGSVFTVSDTTKKPGFSGLYHEYLIIRPARVLAENAGMYPLADRLKIRETEMEDAITEHYSARAADEDTPLTMEGINHM
jgi:hypothetical protein